MAAAISGYDGPKAGFRQWSPHKDLACLQECLQRYRWLLRFGIASGPTRTPTPCAALSFRCRWRQQFLLRHTHCFRVLGALHAIQNAGATGANIGISRARSAGWRHALPTADANPGIHPACFLRHKKVPFNFFSWVRSECISSPAHKKSSTLWLKVNLYCAGLPNTLFKGQANLAEHQIELCKS